MPEVGPGGLGPVASVLRMNTRLFERCLEGVAEADGLARPMGVNSITFLFMHVVDARHYLAGLLGPELDNPLKAYADVRSIDEAADLPSLAELLALWREVSPAVQRRVEELTADAAAAESPADFPIDDATIRGAVAFLVLHESYHLGQIGLLRRQLGYPGMRWTE